jgi:hypothetical protein
MVAFRALDETVDAATSVVFPGLPVCCPDTVRGTRHAFSPCAVDAWPELTDAILTELSGRGAHLLDLAKLR